MAKLLAIQIIEFIVGIYDFITLPVYYIIQTPWRVREEATRPRSRQIGNFTWVNVDNVLDKSYRRSIDTLDQLFRDSVQNYAEKNCLGVRKVLGVELKDSKGDGDMNGAVQNGAPAVSQPKGDSPVILKYDLDDKYTWLTYRQIEETVVNLSSGLVKLCGESIINPDGSRKLLICADTCMQWFLTAHACFRNNITVVTAYTTLDDEAILHSINQTEVKILVVNQKFIRRVPKIIKDAHNVDTIIVLDEPLPSIADESYRLKPLLSTTNIKRVLSYNDIIERGKTCSECIVAKPTGDDIAVLMYTSGSTGKAKGVMLSHKSIVYTALAFSGPGDISHQDRYIGYLPLGHVLELAAECIFLRNGSTIAYSSPATLTSNSPMIKKGQPGDAFIFKPTIMGTVPLVLDRIRNAMQQAIKQQGPFYDQLINDFVVRYKRYWWERCYDTPIMNRLICRKFNLVLGGKIRAVCSGGAALSRDTQEYLRYVANLTLLQGYGLTETSAAASFSDVHERRCNVVGPPYPVVRIRLESWSDYSVHDKPHPRGEIIIGGQPVSSGYYKMDELTKESFFVEDGVRYFRTGDIGMMLSDGVLKIIDRKKDLVKPLSGEYISLGEIESALRSATIVENICVYCSQYSNYIVALVRPETKELRNLAKLLLREDSEKGERFRQLLWKSHLAENNQQQNGVSQNDVNEQILNDISDDTLCSNKWLTERVLELIQSEGNKKKLKRTQIPSKIKLVANEWSPESGLVTASFKLRRREVERFFQADIMQLYAELGQNIAERA